MKPFVVALVFVAAIGVLVWQGLQSAIPVLKLPQLLGGEYAGGRVQTEGEIRSILSISPLRFTVGQVSGGTYEGKDGQESSGAYSVKDGASAVETATDDVGSMTVVASVTVPENFKVGIPVMVRGEFDADTKTFHAYELQTQCPSRYEASEQEGAVVSAGPGESVPASPSTATVD